MLEGFKLRRSVMGLGLRHILMCTVFRVKGQGVG